MPSPLRTSLNPINQLTKDCITISETESTTIGDGGNRPVEQSYTILAESRVAADLQGKDIVIADLQGKDIIAEYE